MKILAYRISLVSCALIGLSGCMVGPNYHKPAVTASPDFKENVGWKPATPAQIESAARWWAIYNDPALDELEVQVEVSNQNLKIAEAQYRAARAATDVDRGALFPTVGVRAAAQRSKRGSVVTDTTGNTVSTSGSNGQSYSIAAQASWDIDIWGKIRRTVEADTANARASAADLAGAKLSAQTLLATDYFQMRAAEAQERLLDQTVTDFNKVLQIAKNRRAAGTATEADVAIAQTQVESVTAQRINVTLTRAQMEHAIAVLIGKAPAEVTLSPRTVMTNVVPVVPAGIATTLLERRPDIAAAEQRAIAANAQIGVAIAAWFPDITLSGSYGFASTALDALFKASSATWVYGAQVAETIFNGGARAAEVRRARADSDVAVATYRQTALTAFQGVEDQLAALRILEQEATVEDITVADARRSEELALNQYKAGTADYTAVATAQTTRVNAEVGALEVLTRRLTASVALVNAVGGGWSGL